MLRRWQLSLLLLLLAVLLPITSGCRAKLPAEFSRMQNNQYLPGAGSPETNLDAGAPLAGELDNANEPGDGGFVPQDPVIDVPEAGIYAFDSLYAIPQQTTAGTGDAVRIVVATGIPANPFKFMNGVRVTFSAGEPSFVAGSYNVGAVGGAQLDADGIWEGVAPESFLLPTDYMLGFTNYDQTGGTWAIDFNVTPINANQSIGHEGELFNFEVAFAEAGMVVLGFKQFYQVKRTYYSDEDSNEYYWGDISNNHAGVANSITVTE
jgi:hypothetical protein